MLRPQRSWKEDVASLDVSSGLNASGGQPVTDRCPECLGTRRLLCKICDGEGVVRQPNVDEAHEPVELLEPCRRCIGTGFEDCGFCADWDDDLRTWDE